jgi:hypothetical protein
MDATEGTQVGPKCRTGPFTGVTVHLASAISIIIPRPLVHAAADGAMGRMAPPITLPLVGIEPRTASGDAFRNQWRAGARVRMAAHPEPGLSRVPRHYTDDGRASTGVGPMPFLLVGTPPGRIGGSRWGVLFFLCILVQFVGLKRRYQAQRRPVRKDLKSGACNTACEQARLTAHAFHRGTECLTART